MNRLQRTGAAVAAALWLASCAYIDRGDARSPEHGASDDNVTVLVPFGSSAKGQRGGGSLLSDLGAQAEGPGCDDNLPNDLVTREIYRRLDLGDTFNEVLGPDQKKTPIQERISAYRRERLAFYEDLFACREGNEGIHEMARVLAANPNDRNAFTNLLVELVETRGDEVLAHYTTEDFNALADFILDQGLSNLRSRFFFFFDYLNRGAIVQRIHARVEEHQEELSVHALKSELAFIFEAQNGLPVEMKTDLQASIEKIVADELVGYLRDQVLNRNLIGPVGGRKYEI